MRLFHIVTLGLLCNYTQLERCGNKMVKSKFTFCRSVKIIA